MPSLSYLDRRTDPGVAETLLAFRDEKAVISWLLNNVTYARWDQAICTLLEKAYAYLYEGGQAARVYALYVQQQRDVHLAALTPIDLAVHRAVMSLAVVQGLPVLAALRYLNVVVRHQSGKVVSPSTVNRALKRLQGHGLLDYEPGVPGLKPRSGRIHLVLPEVSGTPDEVDPAVVSHLALSDEVQIAIKVFREAAPESVVLRSRAAHQQYEERSRPTEEEAIWASNWLHDEAIEEDRHRSVMKAAYVRLAAYRREKDIEKEQVRSAQEEALLRDEALLREMDIALLARIPDLLDGRSPGRTSVISSSRYTAQRERMDTTPSARTQDRQPLTAREGLLRSGGAIWERWDERTDEEIAALLRNYDAFIAHPRA